MNQFEFLDEIEDALNAPETADRDWLVDVAAHYSEAVAELNQRMRGICQLIDQGFRTEALSKATDDPDVLSQVATLDFPRLEEWCYMLTILELHTPPKINFTLAEQLDVAFADQEPLNDLLRRHRALAIGKAQLKSRITVLRQLVNKDLSNQGWQEDLKQWEKARLKEIRDEFEHCKKTRNQASVDALMHEISGPWSIEIPGALAESIETMHRKSQTDQARQQLQQTVAELNQALSAFDVTQGKIQRSNWENQLPAAELQAGDPLWEQAAEALAWLSECDEQELVEKQFEKAIQKLESALDNGVSLDKLPRYVHAVDRLEKPMPAALERRLSRYEDGVQQKQKRKFRLIAGTVFVLLLVAAGLVFWTLQTIRFNRSLDEATQQLSSLYEAEDLDAAQSFYGSLSETIKQEMTVQTIWSQIESKRSDLKLQKERFEKAMSLAEAMDLSEPDYDLIENARKVAFDEEGRIRAETLSNRVRKKQKEMQHSRHEAFLEKLADFDQRIKAVERLPNTAETANGIKELKGELIAFRTQSDGRVGRLPKIESSFRDKLAPLFSRIDNKERDLNSVIMQSAQLTRLSNDVAEPEVFYAGLSKFSKNHPQYYLTDDFKAVVSEWESQSPSFLYAKWQKFFKQPAWTLLDAEPQKAKDLLKQGQELLAQSPQIWLADRFQTLVPVLERMGAGTVETAKGLTLLDENFQTLIPEKLGIVVTLRPGLDQKLGAPPELTSFKINTYYLPYDDNQLSGEDLIKLANNSQRSFKFLLDRRESTKTKQFKKGVTEYLGPSFETALRRYLSSQTADYNKVRNELEKPLFEKQTILKMIAEIVDPLREQDAEKYCDPIMRIYMLDLVMNHAIEQKLCGEDLLVGWLDQMTDLQDDISDNEVDYIAVRNKDNNDYDPDEWQTYQSACKNALGIIEQVHVSFPEIESAFMESEKAIAAISSIPDDIDLKFTPIGYLSRDQQGTWTVVAKDKAELQDQKVVCLYKSKGSKKVGMHPIGAVQDGEIVVDESYNGFAGRLVYAAK